MDPEIALLIPIIAIIMGCFLAGYSIHINQKRRELFHKEKMMAMEKGLPLPKEQNELKNPVLAHKNATIMNRKTFVLLFFLSLAFLAMSGQEPDMRFFGLILLFLSFAFLIMSLQKYRITPKDLEMINLHEEIRERETEELNSNSDKVKEDLTN